MRVLLCALAVALAAPAMAQEVAPADIAQHAIEDFIRPSFDAFLDLSGNLETTTADLCAAPSPAALEDVRGRFAGALDAYARVAFLRFGPLVRENRLERLWLWPDRKGIALKQVQEVLAEQPADALDPVLLTGKSVALQGFNALEFVLFGTGSDDLATAAAYRCSYGHAIAGAIRGVAEAMAAEWHDSAGISVRLIAPQASDADYRSVREVLEELVGAAAHGIEAIRDTQMLPFMGRTRFDPKPRSAPFWRSAQTFTVIASGFKGLEQFFEAAQFGAAVGEDSRWLEMSVRFDFEQVRAALDKVTDPVEPALADPAQVQAMNDLLALTRDLQGLLGDSLAQLLGLSVGFSALDGD